MEKTDMKPEISHVDNVYDDHDHDELKQTYEAPPQMKSGLDDLSTWQALKTYKRVSVICMLAAFSASLDGYQVNLNGGIVSNLGFIHRMFGDNVKVSPGPYVSAWGGIQSAGQFIGQLFLPWVTQRFGRKAALYTIWAILVLSIIIETITVTWYEWLIAKLFAGIGVGCLQGTLPVYIAEHSPTQLRGFLINAYTWWFNVGQLMAPVVLREMAADKPLDFRTPILTQWGMIGAIIVIFIFLPESPWWLVMKGRTEEAEKILLQNNGHVAGYSAKEAIGVMQATLAEEKRVAEAANAEGQWAIFKGDNGKRLFIGLWPKMMQQFAGLVVFNTYSTYFFQVAGFKNPFQVSIILSCVQLMSVTLTACLSDGFGRRPFVLAGYIITAVSVLCLGIVGCFNYAKPSLAALLIFFACMATFSTTGASAIGYAYLAEIPSQHLRAQAASNGLAITNLISIMFSFTAPIMIKGDGKNFKGWSVKTGFFFAATGIPSCVLGYFIVPETTRRTPAEIDELFEKKISLRKFKGYKTDVELNFENLQAQRMAGA